MPFFIIAFKRFFQPFFMKKIYHISLKLLILLIIGLIFSKYPLIDRNLQVHLCHQQKYSPNIIQQLLLICQLFPFFLLLHRQDNNLIHLHELLFVLFQTYRIKLIFQLFYSSHQISFYSLFFYSLYIQRFLQLNQFLNRIFLFLLFPLVLR